MGKRWTAVEIEQLITDWPLFEKNTKIPGRSRGAVLAKARAICLLVPDHTGHRQKPGKAVLDAKRNQRLFSQTKKVQRRSKGKPWTEQNAKYFSDRYR